MRRIVTEWFRGPRERKAGSTLMEQADGVFRQFFKLIGRLERAPPRLETKSEPPRKLRVTRLDEDAVRRP